MYYSRLEFRVWAVILTVSICSSLTGCYPDWPEHSGTANVEGEFTLDGFPFGGAKVIFVPVKLKTETGKIRPIAYGECDANGRFKLRYSDGSTDIFEGRYNVLFSLIKKEEGDEVRWDPLAPSIVKNPVASRVASQANVPNGLHPMSRMSNQKLNPSPTPEEALASLHSLLDQDQVVPSIYNRESDFYYELEASPAIVRCEFKLTSVDPLLNKSE